MDLIELDVLRQSDCFLRFKKILCYGIYFAVLLAFISFVFPHTQAFAKDKAGKKMTVSLDLHEVELPVFIKFVSDITGKSFVFDERVRGKVTIISPREIDVDELYDVFLSILDFKGYTAISEGNVVKIISSKEAKQKGGKVVDESILKEREGFVTRLVPLTFIDAADATRILSPLVSTNGVINFNASTNTLVITASPFDINKLVNLLKKLDKKPEVGQLKVFVYYLENAGAEDMSKSLSELFSRTAATPSGRGAKRKVSIRGAITGPVSITADKTTNALIIRALPEDYDIIKNVLKQLDIRRRQVFVEAAIAEVSLSKLKELGFEFNLMNDLSSSTDAVKGVGGTNFGTIGTAAAGPEGLAAISGLVVGVVKGSFSFGGQEFLNIGALLRAIQSESGINILSTPQLLTTDNQEAEIVVGENVPLITTRTVSSGGNIETAIERQDVGVRLKLTPHIAEGDFVSLDIYQEISSVSENAAFDPNQVGPLLSKRFAQTYVVVKNNQTIVIAGLIKDDTRTIEQKVPLLGDIPLLGRLFRFKKDQKDKTNLLVFITPHIIKDPDTLLKIKKDKEKILKRDGGKK